MQKIEAININLLGLPLTCDIVGSFDWDATPTVLFTVISK